MASTTTTTLIYPITNEQFNLFHSIDRELYSRLIFELGRDPGESMQVMAFWYWIERSSIDFFFVKKVLPLPSNLLDELVDETVTCLKCIESDTFSVEGTAINNLQNFIDTGNLTLEYMHENRSRILRGVTKIVNEVCSRAFEDILRKRFENVYDYSHIWIGSNAAFGSDSHGVSMSISVPTMGSSSGNRGEIGTMVSGRLYCHPNNNSPMHETPATMGSVITVPFYTGYGVVPQMGFGGTLNIAEGYAHGDGSSTSSEKNVGVTSQMVGVGSLQAYEPYDLKAQRQFLNNELGDMLSRVNLTVIGEEEDIPADDRTIFLTFSKGYPTSETEVRDFFTRTFGDFVETIHMQEVVSPNDQVLYARLIARSASIIDTIVGSGGRAKYSINGKHVWARKYVKKPQQPKSPPQVTTTSLPRPPSSGTTSQP
ncbi:unnamed protein product [Ilex paraguariensis]|uniref:Uncharacterized protein n=1 Tax=Ilex paraguariensis TaxID=185542 RepID=A0ABC8SDC1_9AQUA